MKDIFSQYKENPEFVKAIIKENPKNLLVCCKKKGNSLLHILISEGDLEGIKAIICILKTIKNTDNELFNKIINKQNCAGDTPAHIGVRKSRGKNNIYSIIVELLESVGANFTIPNKKNDIIKKLEEPKYDIDHLIIKKYINECLFNNDNNEIFIVSETDGRYPAPDNLDDIGSSSHNILEFVINNNDKKKMHVQNGGKQQNSESSSDSESEFFGKRTLVNPYMKGGSKQSQKIHDEIIQKIKDMKYSDEDAKDIKNFIYYEVKEKYPELNNDERAEKMLEVIDKKLSKIKIEEVRKELEIYRENNKKESKKVSKKVPKKESKKESKKEPKKKTSKRSKKS